MKDRVLLVNYDFPPALAGVRRIVKFAQYLPDYNFEPAILCATPSPRAGLDTDALEDLDPALRVWRTGSPDIYHAPHPVQAITVPFRYLRKKFDLASATESTPASGRRASAGRSATILRRTLALPDDRFPWLATALPMAQHILRSQATRYVVTSSYPNSTHLIGLYLKRRFKIHWHADFRDGWMQNPYFADFITPAHRQLNARLEREVATHADTLTAVSEPIVAYLSELSGRRNVYHLPNGFDPSDLEDIPIIEFDKFTLAYTGTIFMQRSPDSFFAAVRGLLDAYPGLADNFQVIFRTSFRPHHEAMIRDLGLENIIINWGMGTWRESLSLQKSADALLALEGEGSNSHIMLTQKVFEYLAADKPILAVAPAGALADLVRQTGSGVVVHPDNVFRIKETLFELFLGRLNLNRRTALINSYTRQAQAARLAEILRSSPRG